MARVVDGRYNKIVAAVKCLGNFAVERGKSAFVFADFLSVDPEPRVIVGCTYMEKHMRMRLGLVSEVLLVPDRAFVEHERFALRVPVAGNLEFRRLGEVIFGGKRIAGLRFVIHEVAILLLFMMKAEKA